MKKIKSVIANFLESDFVGKLIGLIFQDKIPFNGTIIITKSGLITPSTKGAIFCRIYESAEVRFVKKYLKQSYDVIELGSSIGVIACQVGKRIHRKNKIICVEANPYLKEVIEENLKYNKVESFEIISCAINYNTENEHVNFLCGKRNVDGRLSSSEVHGSIKLPKSTLSSILKQFSIKDFVLICDIEGSEVELLINDINSLDNCKQIIMETHNTVYKGKTFYSEDIEKLITDAGFKRIDKYGGNLVFER
jgi:FkbM family methyltransferase